MGGEEVLEAYFLVEFGDGGACLLRKDNGVYSAFFEGFFEVVEYVFVVSCPEDFVGVVEVVVLETEKFVVEVLYGSAECEIDAIAHVFWVVEDVKISGLGGEGGVEFLLDGFFRLIDEMAISDAFYWHFI